MAFGTLNSILSTTVSITYTCCCAIVLMLHNNYINNCSLGDCEAKAYTRPKELYTYYLL